MNPEENNHSANKTENKVPPKTEIPAQPAKAVAPQPKKKTGFQMVLQQAGLALLFLVIGMLAILLAFYLPAASQLKQAQTELDRLVPMETQYIELQGAYDEIQAQTLVYKMMSNASQLKEALIDKDTNKVTQQLTYIEEDLSQLKLSNFPDLPASLITQFEKVKTSISSSSTTAGSEVEKFYNALLNLSDNLQ